MGFGNSSANDAAGDMGTFDGDGTRDPAWCAFGGGLWELFRDVTDVARFCLNGLAVKLGVLDPRASGSTPSNLLMSPFASHSPGASRVDEFVIGGGTPGGISGATRVAFSTPPTSSCVRLPLVSFSSMLAI